MDKYLLNAIIDDKIKDNLEIFLQPEYDIEGKAYIISVSLMWKGEIISSQSVDI